jgi:hypothetical protein
MEEPEKCVVIVRVANGFIIDKGEESYVAETLYDVRSVLEILFPEARKL